jgi:hypothetical protein
MKDEKPEHHGATTRRAFVGRATTVVAAGAVAGALPARAFAQPQIPEVELPERKRGLPARQFAWGDYVAVDDRGNPQPPRYDRLLFFDVRGRPTAAHARLLEARLRRLEHRYAWSHRGLLFTVSWGCPSYFKLLGVDSPVPKATKLSTFENPAIDRYDMCIHLAGDDERRLAEIEAALVHGRALAGVPGSMSLAAGFVWRQTRTGFTGKGIPAANQHVRGIPKGDPVAHSAPLFMGFQSAFKKNQATEDAVAIPHGPFAQGTVMHVSYMTENLKTWYGQSFTDQDRVSRMFSPETTPEGVKKLKQDAPSEFHQIGTAMRRYGVIGHSQATAQARRHNKPLIIRRDFNTTDGDRAGLHFVAIQRTYEDFVVTRNAMNANGAHLVNKKITATKNNGINAFIDVRRRANYIIPSRADRAFPLLPGRASALD